VWVITGRILDIIDDVCFPWPTHCRACGKPAMLHSLLCQKCADSHRSDEPLVNFITEDGIDASAAPHRYTKSAAAMVRALKFSAVRGFARGMAQDMLSAAAYAGFTAPDAVAYVPMHWMRRRTRYYNHSKLLAKVIASEMNAPLMEDISRIRWCRQQARIRDDAKRRRNVEGAFRVKGDLLGKRILLIDDVCTSGATAKECALALRRAGAAQVLLLTYATAHALHKQ